MQLFDEKKSGGVREAVHAIVAKWPGVEARQMMGCPGWRASGKLFVSVIDQGVMLHTLTAEERAEAKTRLGGGPFIPGPGRSMDSWVVVSVPPAKVRNLEPWLRRCYALALIKAKEAPKARKGSKKK